MRPIIYVFGNPLIKEDSLPIKLIPLLRRAFPSIIFKEIDLFEDIERLGRKINIIDTVFGIKEVELIKDVNGLETQKIYSLHDFDLAHHLKLMKKMKIVDEVNIFGVPNKISEKDAFEQLKKLITKWLNQTKSTSL